MTAVALVAFLFVGAASAQPRPSQSFEYDALGNLTRSTDALNRSTQFTWDALGRPRLTTQPAPASGQPNPTIRYDYNPAGLLTRVTDPRSLATTYNTTGLGDVTSVVSPDTGTTTSTYDPAGNLKTRKDARGKTTTYTYDALNRLTQAQYADGTSTAFFYDEGAAVGQLTRIVDPGVTSTFTYDLHGRVLTRTQTVLNGSTPLTQTLAHSYTPGTGKRRQSVYPSGRVLTLDYHPSTKVLQTVSFDGVVVAGAVQWHALSSLPKSLRLANGQTWTSTMDLEGRLQSYSFGGSTWTLSWDAAHRLTQVSNGNTSESQSFVYDGLDRITSFTSNPRDQSFTYDANGNLTSKLDRVGTYPSQTDTFTIAANSNRMTQIANLGIGFGYDAAGNRTTTPTTTHTYNAKGRLIKSVVVNGGTTKTSNYLYNALEQRVRKSGAPGFVIYVYDDAGQLIGEYDNLGRAKREYVWLPHLDGQPGIPSYRPIAVVTYAYVGTSTTPNSRTIFAIEVDHLGAPRRVSNATNKTRWTWTPAPFGDTLPNENPQNLGLFTLNLRFPGQYFDAETNLTYNHHRDYEATTGRYIQSDPIGLGGGVNTYAYVGGNPLYMVDPYGLFGWSDMPTVPQSWVDFSAGMGDVLLFGQGQRLREFLDIGSVDRCSDAYSAGEWAGIAASLATGVAGGLKAAGTRGAGREFSHWIPNRMGGPRSVMNGNYVSTEAHALSDPYRYRFMPRDWKAANPMPNQLNQQWARVPNLYKGGSAGAAYGAGGAATNDCSCKR